MLSNIEVLNNALPTIEDLVSMAMVVNYKAIHKFVLQKCEEQTMAFTKKFKLRGNYTWKINNTQKRSRIDLALANQNLISGVTGMKHTWNQSIYSDHAMVTVVVHFETIDKGYGLFKCPSELHNDVNYQAIIKSTIQKCLLEEMEETE